MNFSTLTKCHFSQWLCLPDIGFLNFQGLQDSIISSLKVLLLLILFGGIPNAPITMETTFTSIYVGVLSLNQDIYLRLLPSALSMYNIR